jgi:hypothetical protein
MRYRDINRFRLPVTHPVLAEIVIDPEDWGRLQQLDADNAATAIVGHDAPQNGKMTVFLACTSDEVRNRLEDGWN